MDPNATGMVVVNDLASHGGRIEPGVVSFKLNELFSDGPSLYQYVCGNPVNLRDPYGLWAGLAIGLLAPGPSDFIREAMRSLVEDYAANLDWDADWASDWSMPDDAHTRLRNDWIGVALGRGLYNAFETGVPFTDIGGNPLDAFGSKRIRSPNAPHPGRFPQRHVSGAGPYSHLTDPPGVGPGKEFSPSQRNQIYAANKAQNGGRLRSDVTGRYLSKPGSSSPNAAQVDHIMPKSRGGSNSSTNAQVVEAFWNQSKGNRLP
jgi:hypothetical protein